MEEKMDLKTKLKYALYMIGEDARVSEVDGLNEKQVQVWLEIAKATFESKMNAGAWRN